MKSSIKSQVAEGDSQTRSKITDDRDSNTDAQTLVGGPTLGDDASVEAKIKASYEKGARHPQRLQVTEDEIVERRTLIKSQVKAMKEEGYESLLAPPGVDGTSEGSDAKADVGLRKTN